MGGLHDDVVAMRRFTVAIAEHPKLPSFWHEATLGNKGRENVEQPNSKYQCEASDGQVVIAHDAVDPDSMLALPDHAHAIGCVAANFTIGCDQRKGLRCCLRDKGAIKRIAV